MKFHRLNFDIFDRMKKDVIYNEVINTIQRVSSHDNYEFLERKNPLWEYERSFGRLYIVYFGEQPVLYKDHSRLVVPASCRGEVMKENHMHHEGTRGIYKKAHQRFYWPNMKLHYAVMTRSCEICSRIDAMQ